VKYLRRQSLGDLLVSAGAWLLRFYIRPIGYFLPMIIAAGLAAWALVTRRQNKLRFLAHAGAFVIVSVTLTGLGRFGTKSRLDILFSQLSPPTTCTSSQRICPGRPTTRALLRDERPDGLSDQSVYLQEHPDRRTGASPQRVNYKSQAAGIYAGQSFDIRSHLFRRCRSRHLRSCLG